MKLNSSFYFCKDHTIMSRNDHGMHLPICIGFLLLCVFQGIQCIFTDLGCFTDYEGQQRDLGGPVSSFSTPTVELCAAQCQPNGYPYGGLQMGRYCYCGQTFGLQEYSTACNFTCNQQDCGGYLCNSVYYTVDNLMDDSRVMVYNKTPATWMNARMQCVRNNGDLTTVNTKDLASHISDTANKEGYTSGYIWIGLRRRVTGQWFEWADENEPSFDDNSDNFISFWEPNQPNKSNDCVMMEVSTKLWKTYPCDSLIPSVCFQLPLDEATPAATTELPTTPAPDTPNLALYILLPFFFLCYGGSCILFCIYKLYRTCWRNKKSMALTEQLQASQLTNVSGSDGNFKPLLPVYVADKPVLVRTEDRSKKPDPELLPPDYFSPQEKSLSIIMFGPGLPQDQGGKVAPQIQSPDGEANGQSKFKLSITEIMRMKLMKQEAMKKQGGKG